MGSVVLKADSTIKWERSRQLPGPPGWFFRLKVSTTAGKGRVE